MLTYLKNLRENKFFKSVAVLASGTFLAQAITIIFTPIVTRLYGPEAFGTLGVFTSLLAVVVPIAALSYPFAIVLPSSEKHAIGLLKLSLNITIIVTISLITILFFFKDPILIILNIETLGNFIWFIPIGIFFSGLYDSLTNLMIRRGKFKTKAIATVTTSLIQNGAKSLLGIFYPYAACLVIISSISNAFNSLALYYLGLSSKAKARIILKWSNSNLFELAKKYRAFAYFQTPQMVLNAASKSISVIMLTAFYGPTEAGYFTLAFMTLTLPTNIVGSAIGNAIYPKFAESARNNSALAPMIGKASLVLACLGMLPYMMIMIMGPFVYPIVFGDDWVVSGEYARWLALVSWTSFMMLPSVKMLPILKAQNLHFVFTSVLMVCTVLAFYIGNFLFDNSIQVIILYSSINAALNILLLIMTYILSVRHDVRID